MNAEVLDFSMDNENKNLALEGAISQIEKNFGKGSVMKLGENDQNIDGWWGCTKKRLYY